MQKPNILIVDDVSINRELLSYILRDQYQIYEAENGAQAIEMIESQDRLYHLVLLDIQMPGIDGFGVLEKMKEMKLLRHLPVIIISGESSDAAILHAYKLGAVDFFTKPYSAATGSYTQYQENTPHDSAFFDLFSTMTHTIAALEDMGFEIR